MAQGETRNEQELTKEISDVVWVYRVEGNHWETVHLYIKAWRLTYYDSMLGQRTRDDENGRMKDWCSTALDDVRRRQRKLNTCLPDGDPPMSRTYTIRQQDNHSCRPLALREGKRLMGLPVEDDREDPVRIRLRHLRVVHTRMTHRMLHEPPDDPSPVCVVEQREQVRAQEERWNGGATQKPECQKVQPHPQLGHIGATPMVLH